MPDSEAGPGVCRDPPYSLEDSSKDFLAHTCAGNHPYNEGAKKLADLVSAKTGGRLKITVCPSGRFGGERDIIEALQARTNRVGGGISPPSSYTTVRAVRHKAVHGTLGNLRLEIHQAQRPLVAPVGEA